MAVNVAELLQTLAEAVETARAKALVVEETKAAFEAASQDSQAAAVAVAQARDAVNDAVGSLVPDARVRVSR
jgi:hypothetical protein